MLFAGLVAIVAAPAVAQSPNTATVVVAVVDQSGAALSGAAVSVVNDQTQAARDAVSTDDGTATIAALPLTGTYTIHVTHPGFSGREVHDLTLRAGETATVKVILPVGGEASQVTVYGTTEGVRADPQLGTRFDSERIDETPILGRKITYLPLLNSSFRTGKGTGDLFINSIFAVSGAGGRRETTYVVDGATANEPWGRQAMFSTIPSSAVEEMDVMSSAFSAEFGWTAGPAVNIVTKSGTNVLHGEALYLGRPASWENSTAMAGSKTIATPDVPDVLHQVSGTIGGPIVRDRTFFFAAGDYTRQDRTAFFSSNPVTQSLLNGQTSYTGNYRQALLDARVDHKLSATNTVMARFNLDRFYDNNPQDAVSNVTLPSAGRVFRRHTYTGQVNDTAILSNSLLNEARFVYENGDPITDFDPLHPSTQYARSGVATEGESRFAHVYSRQAELSDTLTWTRGVHYLRFGGNLARTSSGGDGTEFGSAYVLGQFTISPSATAPLDQLTIDDATRYTEGLNFGIANYAQKDWIYALFAQDSIRARSDLTLDLGLRYDRETFTDGKANFAPRIGFGWNPRGDANTAVRGGYGIYYTMLKANLDASFTLGGPDGFFNYTAAPGQLGFPTSLGDAPVSFPAGTVLPARNITIRPGMASYYSQFFDVSALPGYAAATFVNPRSQVGSIGIERQIAPRVFVSADYVKQHWTGLDQTVDLNAPALLVRTVPGQVRSAAAADATRPIHPTGNGYRQINVIENAGVADYDGLETMVRWQNPRVFLSASYTLSKATNTTEPNGNGPGPNDFNQIGEQERGPSILDQRHRAVLTASYRFPFDLTVGTVNQLASARPFNATTGVDNNGDGSNNDRPVIDGAVVSRAAFRGTPTYDTSIFAEWRVAMSGRSATLRLEGFNLFNHANILGWSGVYGNGATPNASFGLPATGLSNVDPARMFQFSVRYQF